MHNQATVRVGPLTNIPYILEFLGYEAEPILAASGFNLAQFEDPDNRISFRAGSKLLARCVEVTKCHHFGLLLGKQANPSHLGIAGFLLSSAPNVGSALGSLIKYLDLHDKGGMGTLKAVWLSADSLSFVLLLLFSIMIKRASKTISAPTAPLKKLLIIDVDFINLMYFCFYNGKLTFKFFNQG